MRSAFSSSCSTRIGHQNWGEKKISSISAKNSPSGFRVSIALVRLEGINRWTAIHRVSGPEARQREQNLDQGHPAQSWEVLQREHFDPVHSSLHFLLDNPVRFLYILWVLRMFLPVALPLNPFGPDPGAAFLHQHRNEAVQEQWQRNTAGPEERSEEDAIQQLPLSKEIPHNILHSFYFRIHPAKNIRDKWAVNGRSHNKWVNVPQLPHSLWIKRSNSRNDELRTHLNLLQKRWTVSHLRWKLQ